MAARNRNHRSDLPVLGWLKVGAAAAGVGVALTTATAVAQADDGSAKPRDPSGVSTAQSGDAPSPAAASAGRRPGGANRPAAATTANRANSNRVLAPAVPALVTAAAAPTVDINQPGTDLAVPAPVTAAAVVASATARATTVGFGTVYPAPVTAPVTVRAIVAETLTAVGLGMLVPGLPVPAAPVPDLVAGLWVDLRRIGYTFFNSYPTLSQSTAPVQNPLTGVVTGRVVGTDANQDQLTYHVSDAAHGTVVIAPDGSYTYTPDSTFAGTDSFSLSVEDVTGNPVHLYGGAGIVHSLLEHYAPGYSSPDTMVVTVNPGGVTGGDCYRGCNIVGSAPPALTANPSAYPDPVTAPVTLRSFAADTLSWFGMGSAAAAVPIPAVPVGPVLTTIWNSVRQLHHLFLNSYPTLSLGAQTQDMATGSVTGTLVGSDVDQNTLTYHVGSAAHGTVVLAPDGTYTYTPDETLAHLGGTDTFVASVEDVTANPFHVFGGWDMIHALLEHLTPFGLGNPDTKIVTVHVAPGTVNSAPVVAAPTLTAASAATGAVGGSLAVTDADGDRTSFRTQTGPSKGTVTVDATTGNFVYTPDAAARHAAAAIGATAADLTDTFTIAVSDGFGGTTLKTVTVAVTPSNTAPVVTTTAFSTANPTTGVVSGNLTATDAESDLVSFRATSSAAKGTVVVESGGNLTYAPTTAAQHSAAADNATAADLTDTFTIVADDGHGGTVTKTITVVVNRSNVAPTFSNAVVGAANVSTGVVGGALSATDAEADPLSFLTVTAPTKGTVTVNPNGTFTYTPSAIARQNARVTPTPANQTDTFTVMVNDGHGGTALQTITVAVQPDNSAPVFGATTFGAANQAGAIGGTVTATDAEADPITFSTQTGPTKGTVTVNANGTFTYTPTSLARHTAGANNATPADQTDTFTVLASDGRGGTTLQTVTIAVDPIAVNAVPTAAVTVNTNNFINGDFSNNLTGWTAINSRVIMGTSSVAGFVTPVDPTNAPDGGIEASTVGSGNYQTTVTGGRAVLTSNLSGVVNTPAGSGGVVHGPVVVSNDPASIRAGATVSFDWEASGGADAFDVLGYIVNVDTGTSYIMLNATGANAATTQPITTVTYTVPVTGNYKFVFVSGSWDATRGTAAGARLSIDNVQILNNVSQTGTVTGQVAGNDANGDTLTYSGPANGLTSKGSITLDANTGAFSFTPTAGARQAAQAQGAPASDLTDTFNVTVDDGFGGVIVVPVTVPIN